MDFLTWIRSLSDASALLASVGPWTLEAIAVLVFIESGVLFPFLPGDSLLVAATIARTSLGVSAWQVILVATLAAVAGDQVGFWLGRRCAWRLFHPNSKVLSTARLEAAQLFFDRHGPAAVVLARFIPVVRTFVPVAAGAAGMRARHFVAWNIPGALGWVTSMVSIGAILGQIPGLAHSIEGITVTIIALSLVPLAIRARVRRTRDTPSSHSTGGDRARTEHGDVASHIGVEGGRQ